MDHGVDVMHGGRTEAGAQLCRVQPTQVTWLKAPERLRGEVTREQVAAHIRFVVGDGPWLYAGAEPSDPVEQIPPKGQALVGKRLADVDDGLRLREALLCLRSVL